MHMIENPNNKSPPLFQSKCFIAEFAIEISIELTRTILFLKYKVRINKSDGALAKI